MASPSSLLRPLNAIGCLAAALFFAVALHLVLGASALRPVASLAAEDGAPEGVPPGAVLAFDRPACPSGWSEFTGDAADTGTAGAAGAPATSHALRLCVKDG